MSFVGSRHVCGKECRFWVISAEATPTSTRSRLPIVHAVSFLQRLSENLKILAKLRNAHTPPH